MQEINIQRGDQLLYLAASQVVNLKGRVYLPRQNPQHWRFKIRLNYHSYFWSGPRRSQRLAGGSPSTLLLSLEIWGVPESSSLRSLLCGREGEDGEGPGPAGGEAGAGGARWVPWAAPCRPLCPRTRAGGEEREPSQLPELRRWREAKLVLRSLKGTSVTTGLMQDEGTVTFGTPGSHTPRDYLSSWRHRGTGPKCTDRADRRPGAATQGPEPSRIPSKELSKSAEIHCVKSANSSTMATH